MKHIKFFLKYYKYYHQLEIAYTPDYIFKKERQERLKINYESLDVFHNDSNKNFSHVCLSGKDGKKGYKRYDMMSVQEKRQFIADYLSGE